MKRICQNFVGDEPFVFTYGDGIKQRKYVNPIAFHKNMEI